jgi:L-seryl-tRNA(Ser) seleniumtransferase
MSELARLPKVDQVVDAEELSEARALLGRRAVTALVRDVIAELRERARAGEPVPERADVIARVRRSADRRRLARLGRVVNATGVLLHTNLGRAPLPRASLERVAATAGGYVNLELDVELGVRTRRGAVTEATLADLVGAEDALIVNNNAAAVLLALSTIAAGREVIVSRGELVEIGGGFRIPEVLARSGARLLEVGTTNRTRLDDYERAIGDRTACLLRVHPSNFKMTGFAERPPLAVLAALAQRHDLPLVKDLGGGLVSELPAALASRADLSSEPMVQSCLRAGATLVCFSLDKLFGGPQGGAIVGARRWVGLLRSDPLARAVRVDKMTLAALEPVLDAYALGRPELVPVQAMLRTPVSALRERVLRWQQRLGALSRHTDIVETDSAIGGGSLAEAPFASVALAVRHGSAEAVSRALRDHEPPIIGRIEDEAVLLDARTVLPSEDDELVAAVSSVLKGGEA